MSRSCVDLSPPASKTMTTAPRRMKWTRWPGPWSTRSSETPSPTARTSSGLPSERRRIRMSMRALATRSRRPVNRSAYSTVCRTQRLRRQRTGGADQLRGQRLEARRPRALHRLGRSATPPQPAAGGQHRPVPDPALHPLQGAGFQDPGYGSAPVAHPLARALRLRTGAARDLRGEPAPPRVPATKPPAGSAWAEPPVGASSAPATRPHYQRRTSGCTCCAQTSLCSSADQGWHRQESTTI